MKRLPTILFTSLLISLLCAGSRSGYAGEARGVTDDTIKIGIIMDQTGVASSETIPVTIGARTYLQNISDQGGINGRKVKFIVEDDRYTIPGAFACFKKLIFRNKVLSILICGGTGQTLALVNQIEKHKVPIMGGLAETLTTPVRRYIFTPAASYEDGVKVCVDYIMKDLKAKNPKIVCVYPDIEYGKACLRVTKEHLKKYNLELSATSIINLGDVDTTSQVLVLKSSDPDYIILHTFSGGLISFYRAAKIHGLRSKIIGSSYLSNEDYIKATGDGMKDTLVVSAFGHWSENTPGMAKLRRVTTKYGAKRMAESKNYTLGWLASMTCAEGLKRAGRNLNPDTLVEAYETFKNFSTGGISGTVSYSKNNHKGGTESKMYKADVKNQTFIPITGFREPAFKD